MIIQFAALLAIIPGARLDGIGHVAYLVLPEIAEMARETKVRPERPLGIAVIASQQAMALRHRLLHHVGIALLSGRHGTYCHAPWHSPEHQPYAAHSLISGRQWLLLLSQLPHGGGCHQFRPYRSYDDDVKIQKRNNKSTNDDSLKIQKKDSRGTNDDQVAPASFWSLQYIEI